MALNIDTIICLEDGAQYVLLSRIEYEGAAYFLAMGVDEKKEIIPHKVAILEEITEDGQTYVEPVTNPELVVYLTPLLKAFI